MTKQEAIEILNKNAPKSDPRLCALELCSAIYVVTKALQEPERKWIPVSERLPEDEYGVLVTVNGKHNNTTFIDALEIAEYDSDEGWIIEGYLDWINPDVTAWMPLPEPDKESEEE